MRELLAWLAEWQNWIFLLPLGLATVMVLLDTVMGGLGDLDLDVDADLDADLDADADTDASVGLLAWLGVGQIPITLLLEIFALSFGTTGLVLNAVFADWLGETPVLTFPVSVAVAGVAAVLTTKTLGGILASLMPSHASTSRRPEDFIGKLGIATSPVGPRIGQIRLPATPDAPSTVLSVRLEAEIATPIPRGMEVLIVRYDTNSRVYAVIPNPMEV